MLLRKRRQLLTLGERRPSREYALFVTLMYGPRMHSKDDELSFLPCSVSTASKRPHWPCSSARTGWCAMPRPFFGASDSTMMTRQNSPHTKSSTYATACKNESAKSSFFLYVPRNVELAESCSTLFK